MAINPEISLGVRPAQIENPLDSFGKALSVRNMVRQGQLHDQQIQLGQQELQMGQLKQQQVQQAMDEDAMVRQAYGQAAAQGGGVEAVRKLLVGKVSPARLNAIDKEILDAQEKRGKISEQNLKNSQAQNAMVASAGQALLKLPPEQRPAAWTQERARLIEQGVITADHAPEQYPGDDWVQLNVDHALTADVLFTQEMKRREDQRAANGEQRAAAIAVSQLAEANTKAAVADRQNAAAQLGAATDKFGYAKIFAGLPPEMRSQFPDPMQFDPAKTPAQVRQIGMTAEQQTQATQAAANAAQTKAYQDAELKQGQQRIGIQAQEQALRQKTFDATYGALVDPNTGKPLEGEAAKAVAMQDPLATAIANYQSPPPSVNRGGAGASVMRKVLAINPQYNAQNWQGQQKILNDFTSGKSAQELAGVNTALGHVGVLNEAVAALNNGDVRLLNSIGNRLGVETGSTPVGVFKTIVHRVGPELVKAYTGAAGGQAEREVAAHDFDPNLSPEQLKANIAMTAHLLQSKLDAKQSQWKNVMGDRSFNFLSPEAQSTMQKLNSGGSGGRGAKPYSQTATGPNGHKIGTNDGGKTWFDVETGKQVQ